MADLVKAAGSSLIERPRAVADLKEDELRQRALGEW